MKFNIPRLTTLVAASVITILTFVPVAASADGQRSGRTGGESSGGGTSSGGGGSSSGGGGRTGERVGSAVPRSDGGARSGDSSSGGTGGTPTARTGSATRGDDGTTAKAGGTGRPDREGQRVGQAQRRRDGGGGTTIIVPGGYYGGYLPWGYAGLGFAGYYGGYYDPLYGYPQYGGSSGEEGTLRLKVKPREASVFVDGYFAGQVDEFDGLFQRLHIEPGPHRIEISAEGYETLTFEIRAEPDRTTTYKGKLNRVQ